MTDKLRSLAAQAASVLEATRTSERKLNPRWRGRYVPAEVRRAVWESDGGQCSYVDERGIRCRETSHLELHHKRAHALGGLPTAENLTLRCKAHNALAAEEDFGRELMDRKRSPAPAR